MADLALWGYSLLRGGAPEQVAVARHHGLRVAVSVAPSRFGRRVRRVQSAAVALMASARRGTIRGRRPDRCGQRFGSGGGVWSASLRS